MADYFVLMALVKSGTTFEGEFTAYAPDSYVDPGDIAIIGNEVFNVVDVVRFVPKAAIDLLCEVECIPLVDGIYRSIWTSEKKEEPNHA